jgi:hypothetical protein
MENSTEKPSDSRVDVSSTRLLAESLEVIRELLKYGQHEGPCDNEPKEHEEAWEAPACTLHLAAHKQRHDAAVAFLARASANQ